MKDYNHITLIGKVIDIEFAMLIKEGRKEARAHTDIKLQVKDHVFYIIMHGQIAGNAHEFISEGDTVLINGSLQVSETSVIGVEGKDFTILEQGGDN